VRAICEDKNFFWPDFSRRATKGKGMRIPLALALVGLLAFSPTATLAADNNQNPSLKPPAPVDIALPGLPFGVSMSHDGNWIFVAILGGRGGKAGVAIIGKENGKFALKRMADLGDGPAGIVLTHDGKNLIGAMGNSVLVLDTARLISGEGDPVVAKIVDSGQTGVIYVNVTADDKTLFVSNEGSATISVIDLERVRSHGFDAQVVVGRIPVGLAPIALTFSPDGRWLYTTSEGASPDWNWPARVKVENHGPRYGPLPHTTQGENRRPAPANTREAAGAVVVVDVVRARTDPAHSVVARVPAGSSPVRMAISPDGGRIYVTARGENALLVFDTAKLQSDPDHALVGRETVGAAPVPVAVIQGGKTVVVGNSNRFNRSSDSSTLTVLDATRLAHGPAVIGTIPCGSFPRELCVSTDGKTLCVTNFRSSTLEIIDAENPPIERK
jgi:DNA-binding beta-propeller fold protein YncE